MRLKLLRCCLTQMDGSTLPSSRFVSISLCHRASLHGSMLQLSDTENQNLCSRPLLNKRFRPTMKLDDLPRPQLSPLGGSSTILGPSLDVRTRKSSAP